MTLIIGNDFLYIDCCNNEHKDIQLRRAGFGWGGKRLVPIHRVKGPLCFRETARVINRVGRTASA